MEFEEIYEKLISYENLDKKEQQIECHKIPRDKKDRMCVFCGKTHPEVTFSKVAHAVSETLGNKKLISHYECDDCNMAFGSVIEDSFGKYIAPFKLISKIYGKNSTLTIKDFPKDKSLSYKSFRLESHQGFPAFDVDGTIRNYIIEQSDTGILKEIDGGYLLTIPRQKYNPRYVYAALLKMGYSLLPLSEIKDWIHDTLYLGEYTRNFKSQVANEYFSCLPDKGVLTFYGGINPLNGLGVHLYRRKYTEEGSKRYFKYLFRLDFFNFSITIPLVFHSENGKFTIPISQYQNATSWGWIDFTKEEVDFSCEFSAQQIEIPRNQYNEIEDQLRKQKLLRDKE